MKEKLMPFIRYGSASGDGGLFTFAVKPNDVPYLCVPLIPASKKRLIEALARAEALGGMEWDGIDADVKSQFLARAKVALAALEGLARESEGAK